MRASRAEIVAFLSAKMEELYPMHERVHIARNVAAALEGVNLTKYLIDPNEVVTIDNIDDAGAELAAGRPMQYIIGNCDFCSLNLYVGEGVLIPRPETEELVMWANDYAQQLSTPTIVDLCAGSGCIALAMKHLNPSAEVTAVELSDKAIAYIDKNRQKLNLDIEIVKTDVLAGLSEIDNRQFDIIISNPPYIPSSEASMMHINVTNHEPHMALFVPDNDPLIFYRAIAQAAHRLLTQQGRIFFEIHESLAKQTANMLEAEGYHVSLRNDYFNKPRMICCQPTKRR